MKKKRLVLRTIILGLFVAALGYTVYANSNKDKSTIKVGETAPDFALETLDGKKVKLSDMKGKGVFLNFWGTWCKPCEKEMPYMEKSYQFYKDKNIEILAVNIGESNLAVTTFVDRHRLTFPILMDRQSQVTDHYQIGPIPTTFLIDKNGVIKKVITGSMTQETVNEYMRLIEPK
ncbi:thiol-disulfide oxidoreductase ResA [Peribacillus castrilensis]|uniref:thiol-disulfide oxidoreductase ResA n=1 Tax=Peribacillus TaxID=2675229 RepID=UPI0038714933